MAPHCRLALKGRPASFPKTLFGHPGLRDTGRLIHPKGHTYPLITGLFIFRAILATDLLSRYFHTGVPVLTGKVPQALLPQILVEPLLWYTDL